MCAADRMCACVCVCVCVTTEQRYCAVLTDCVSFVSGGPGVQVGVHHLFPRGPAEISSEQDL